MKRILLIALVFFVFQVESSSVQASSTRWEVGVAELVITPEQYIWMAGYASRTKPAQGKLHDLRAKALFLEDSVGNKALLITTDLLGFPKGLSDRIRKQLRNELSLTDSQIILSSSHTHTGPVLTDGLSNIYSFDTGQKAKIDSYSNWLADQLVELAKKAEHSLQPANIYAGNGVVRFQVNRRNNKESELEKLFELEGPNDYAVPVLKVENKRGEIKAIVFGYACHPTVINDYEWSGDYPGFAQLELEDKYKGATALFFQGAGADQNPLPRRSVSLAKQYGQELASAVECVLSEDMLELDPVLTTAYREIDLQLNNPPTEEELTVCINNSEGWLKKWAQDMQEKQKSGKPIRTSYPYPVQLWGLGAQNIFSLGGELLVGYSIDLKKIFGPDIFVMGYSNDVMAYIPTDLVLSEGGYEGETSQMVYGLPSTWKAGIEKIIIEAAVGLAEEVGISLDEESKNNMDAIFEMFQVDNN